MNNDINTTEKKEAPVFEATVREMGKEEQEKFVANNWLRPCLALLCGIFVAFPSGYAVSQRGRQQKCHQVRQDTYCQALWENPSPSVMTKRRTSKCMNSP